MLHGAPFTYVGDDPIDKCFPDGGRRDLLNEAYLESGVDEEVATDMETGYRQLSIRMCRQYVSDYQLATYDDLRADSRTNVENGITASTDSYFYRLIKQGDFLVCCCQ
ncbi:unnamed protein product [Toxocara canis]|uniref:Uncharacterized protein n=1 Tax=Toxocara canis TaxID=6265 RepID=A0A3P7FEF9_TOXCA|nr:unnamed protein product [Toxocara canis]